LEDNANRLLLGRDKGERADLLYQPLDAFDAPFGFSARHEITQPANDLPGSHRLVTGLVQRLPQLDRAMVGGMFEQSSRSLQIIGNGGKRLIELVSKGRCHLPHGAQPRHVQQL
jgi:hypothetical protein